MKMRTQQELKEVLKNALSEVWSEKMLDYCMKESDYIVELENGEIISIDKPRIKKDFCFGHGYCGITTQEDEDRADNMVAHARTSTDYFLEQNLKGINQSIEAFQKVADGKQHAFLNIKYTGQSENNPLKRVMWCRGYEAEDYKAKYNELSQEGARRIVEGYKEVRNQFVKRLNTYLKKYGLTKVNAWSYLSD